MAIVALDIKLHEEIGAGVPQGSVLGPTLWNILYDGVLDLKLMKGVTCMTYADHLIIIVGAIDSRDLMYKANESLERIVEWMDRNDLQIVPKKSRRKSSKVPESKKVSFLKYWATKFSPKMS